MIGKGTKLYSVLNNKCPKCHEGSFFISQPYALNTFGKKHEYCSCCGLKFEREPGFFYGSMYFTYAIGAGLFLVWWLLQTTLFPSMEAHIMILIMAALQIVIAPLSLYLAKLIWINLFFSYQKNQ